MIGMTASLPPAFPPLSEPSMLIVMGIIAVAFVMVGRTRKKL
jgi:hypothetical protein